MEMTKYKLGDLCRIASSKRIFESEYVEKGVPFIRGQEISDGSILDPKASFECYISQSRYEEIKEKYGKPTKGDILITAVGTMGNLCYLDKDIDFYFKYGNVIWFSEIISSCEGKFLFHFMKSSFFKDQLKYFMIGAVQKALTIDMLKKVEVPLPPLSEQKKIASVLSALDDKIALNKKMNQKLEAMAKRLYDYWFVQYDFPDKNGHPYKTTGGPMTYNPTLKREIPAGWADGVLSDIANITMGQSPDGASYNEDGEGMIFYQGSTDFGMRFPTVRQYTTAPTRFAKKGDILMSIRAPVGAVNIANTDCCIGRGLSALNSKLGSLSHLYFLIDVFKKTFENKNTVGTTFGSITKDELYALPVVIPDKKVIEQFEKMAKPIFDRQMKLGEESNRLTKLRDKLLPLLMNGQVVVDDFKRGDN